MTHSDLVERLKAARTIDAGGYGIIREVPDPLCLEAAESILTLQSQLAEARNSGLEEAAKAVEKFVQSAKSSAMHSRGLAETYPRRRAYHSAVAGQCEAMGKRLDEIAAAIRSLKSGAS